MTPKRKKQIRKVSTTSQSEHNPPKSKAPKPSKNTRMGRPENKDEENIFMEELKRCAPCINLELEIQVLVWLRYFGTRSVQQSIEGLRELYENAGCLEVYEALLRQDYLSLELTKEEEEKFTSNIDCQFMVHYMAKNGKTEWSSQELLMLILALLRWRKLVNTEVMGYFQRVLPRFERLPRTEQDLKSILEQVINPRLTQELLEKKLAALVNKLKEHMNLKEKPHVHRELKKEEDVRLHEEQ